MSAGTGWPSTDREFLYFHRHKYKFTSLPRHLTVLILRLTVVYFFVFLWPLWYLLTMRCCHNLIYILNTSNNWWHKMQHMTMFNKILLTCLQPQTFIFYRYFFKYLKTTLLYRFLRFILMSTNGYSLQKDMRIRYPVT